MKMSKDDSRKIEVVQSSWKDKELTGWIDVVKCLDTT